jgi:hypothetical protein
MALHIAAYLALLASSYAFIIPNLLHSRSASTSGPYQQLEVSPLRMTNIDQSFFYSKKEFADIGLSTTMDGVLKYLSIQKPSKIQVRVLSFNIL